ncbi:MAG TPA: DUF420 domain-containing protein [Pirellulaceae bacterium]|nr:DUF420 domain-containing protein [Pirellulaceae bacterium]HMO91359.1 DUF420 domain-containing protein [Pirellulaceae bacterium]HMP70249.1 DUF420 domain-containing protein [Pirellulaceae bacterium]
MSVLDLPHVNASLNGLASILLLIGYILIKAHKEVAHRWTMLACFGVSCLFLVCYVIYHLNVPSKPFPRGDYQPFWSYVYFAVLISHVLLAALVPFLAIGTIVLGLLNRRNTHRKLARWTFPIWLYVSITGVLVYFMLYWWFTPLEKVAEATRTCGIMPC